jgi:alpha-glucosidase (family GH31 glycosyl hydrolase)
VNEPVSRRVFLHRMGAAAGALTAHTFSASFTRASVQRSIFTLSGIEVELSLTPITEHTLRISLLPVASHYGPQQAFAGEGLRDRSWPPTAHALQDAPAAPVTWGKFTIQIADEPLTVAVYESGSERQRLIFEPATARVTFDLHDRPVFGLGEGGHQFDRRGVVDTMRNGQFKPDQFINGGRSPIPWLISPVGWGLFFHHPDGTFDLTGARGVFRPSTAAEAQDIFLILTPSSEPDPAILLKEFALLTGMPHLPPLWAFGYQQSHRTLASREAVLEEAKTFREKKLPCDVMIYLGTGFAPSGWNTGHGSFAFNPKIFPDPKVMFDQMHRDEMRVILHVLGVPFDLHGRVSQPDPDPDSAYSYWRDHLSTFRTGIDGWWVDDGDELLPEARLTRNRMYWEGALQQRPNVRPFSIQRNGYAGLQQYGFLWSGDVNSAWQTLYTQIAAGLNTALSGIPYWGTDTGGFFSTKELTAELYVRWFQFSAFCPLFRSHGRTWMLRLPWGWNRGDVGPVEDDPKLLPAPEELHHPEVEDICRRYLNLRYRLLPYLYSVVRDAHRTGIPLMRALWFSFPDDPAALSVDDAYMWGDSLLVAPVTSKSAIELTTYLPKGAWFDYWTGESIQGGKPYARPVDLATMPLYVKAGTILPLGPIKQSTLERSSDPLELHIYPGADAHFALYEDDGISMDHTRGVASTINIRWNELTRAITLALAAGSTMHTFTTRKLSLHLVGSSTSKPVEFRGTPVTVAL